MYKPKGANSSNTSILSFRFQSSKTRNVSVEGDVGYGSLKHSFYCVEGISLVQLSLGLLLKRYVSFH